MFIEQTSTETCQSGISAVGRGPNKPSADYNDIKPDMTVEDQCYKKSKCDELPIAKKKGLSMKRSKRGHKKGTKDSRTPKKAGKTVRKDSRDIKALERLYDKLNEKLEEHDQNVSALRRKGADDDESESSEDTNDQDNDEGNRTNKAIKRKKVKFKK